MADEQPSNVHEGATSAEDRKAASALANLDSNADDTSTQNQDQDAINQAMKRLGGGGASASQTSKPSVSSAKIPTAPAKNVKVDAADVTLLVNELELSKAKVTELLKSHDGDAVRALKAYVAA